MELTIDSLKTTGGFSGGLVKKAIEFTTSTGEEVQYDTWIRPLSYYDAAQSAHNLANEEDIIAVRVMRSVCHEDGSPVFSKLSDITGFGEDGMPIMVKDKASGKMVERGGLAYGMLIALSDAVVEVSDLGKMMANLMEKQSSGTT